MVKVADYFMLGNGKNAHGGVHDGAHDIKNILACLEWQVAMGVEDAYAVQPIDRFQEKKTKDSEQGNNKNGDKAGMKHGEQNPIASTNKIAGKTPSPSNIASLSKTSSQTKSIEATSNDDGVARTVPLGSFDAIEQATNMAKQCKTLKDIEEALQQYEGCPSKNLARNMVFGDGAAGRPTLMVIGDAPDEVEDKQGKAFVGPGGQLIKKSLAAAGFDADSNLYFTNSIYWKRPGSRAVNEGEQKSCLPFLLKQIEIIAPQQLWVMGIGGALSFFDSTISKCRAKKNLQLQVGDRSITATISYAPDYYWQKPLEKKSLWQDIVAMKTSSMT